VPNTLTGTDGAGGTATMTLTVAPGTVAEGFRVKVLTQDATGGTFIISHDYGWNSTRWMKWTGSWVAGDAAGPGQRFNYGDTAAFDVNLDVAGVKVRFAKGATGATVGDYWDFYVGYPFLRYSNADDGICIGCHQERVMNHTRARGVDRDFPPNGVRKFSHPVGVPLNVTAQYTDRATILDADGTVGTSTADGLSGATPVRNDTNNMTLGTGNVVRCTTCHSVHSTDSNSLTVDVR
jgi:hypothetical protein